MKSPFPGMDPFLQQRWGSFHTRYATYFTDAINPDLPRGLRAQVEERVSVEIEDDPPRPAYRPDSHVYEEPESEDFAPSAAATAVSEAVAEPVVRTYPPPVQRSVVIRDLTSGGVVVTAVELVSPTNKEPGRGLRDYLSKQSAYTRSDASLLELDLIRGGGRATLADAAGPAARRTLYHASLLNRPLGDRLELYPIPLDGPLPRLALPLRASDRPIAVDLQAVFDVAYEWGYYGTDLWYDAPLAPPPLSEADAAYVQQRIAAWREATASKAGA